MTTTQPHRNLRHVWRDDYRVRASLNDRDLRAYRPTDGPVWLAIHNPNYLGPMVERFSDLGDAVDEMRDRDHDPYYPLWLNEGFEAQVFFDDPQEFMAEPQLLLKYNGGVASIDAPILRLTAA